MYSSCTAQQKQHSVFINCMDGNRSQKVTCSQLPALISIFHKVIHRQSGVAHVCRRVGGDARKWERMPEEVWSSYIAVLLMDEQSVWASDVGPGTNIRMSCAATKYPETLQTVATTLCRTLIKALRSHALLTTSIWLKHGEKDDFAWVDWLSLHNCSTCLITDIWAKIFWNGVMNKSKTKKSWYHCRSDRGK